MLEKDLQKKIIDLLHKKGAWTVKVISANKSGVPDILAVVNGRFVAIEVKNPNGKGVTSELQKRNIKQIQHSGGLSAVVVSIQEVEKLLKEV